MNSNKTAEINSKQAVPSTNQLFGELDSSEEENFTGGLDNIHKSPVPASQKGENGGTAPIDQGFGITYVGVKQKLS